MVRYLITSTKFTGEVEFQYTPNEALKFFENRSAMSDEYLSGLFTKFPFTKQMLVELCSKPTGSLTLAQIAIEITFEDFWNAYGYKVGNKERARKLFNALTLTERVLVMESIPQYDAYLAARPNMEKAYAETYLKQRRFENVLPK